MEADTNTPNLDKLTKLSGQLSGLLADPQPGLMSWNFMLFRVIQEIAEFNK